MTIHDANRDPSTRFLEVRDAEGHLITQVFYVDTGLGIVRRYKDGIPLDRHGNPEVETLLVPGVQVLPKAASPHP
jgi:hypothetical protein